MTDDIEERPVPCSVQLREATSRIADLDLALERRDATIGALRADLAELASTLQGLEPILGAHGITLPADTKRKMEQAQKDINESIGGVE